MAAFSGHVLALWLLWLVSASFCLEGGHAVRPDATQPKASRAPSSPAMQQQMRSWILGLFAAAPAASRRGRHKSGSAPCSLSSTQAAAVISEPAQRRVSFAQPPSADGAYTLQLRGNQSCGASGAALSSYVWAVMALPDKQLVFNSTGPASSVKLKPGTYLVGLLVMDARSNHAVAMRNVTIPRVRLRDRLAGWGS